MLLVPTLPINLISLSCLDENHYISTKNGMEVRHRENDELVMRARKVGGLYIANLERHFDTALIAKETLLLMHKRLSHINIQRLKEMRDNPQKVLIFQTQKLKIFTVKSVNWEKLTGHPFMIAPYTRC